MSTARDGGLSRRDFLGVTGALAGSGLLGGAAGGGEPPAGPASIGPGAIRVGLRVNGVPRDADCDARATLLDVLRDGLGLTGAKQACDRGECGTCTVLLDGRPVYACMVLALQARNREVRTIEGLAKGEVLHPVQRAFVEHDAFQCGFCTPGQIMSAVGLLERAPAATPEDVEAGMCGNLCRCAAYVRIRDAVNAVAKGK
ncbi:MAG: (2Fe-2S)-binding protein [Candidatus Brocadiae bacterium]|nr:(2Fe-2S)-binding protein [Candidatus Brocadiia bacterium]